MASLKLVWAKATLARQQKMAKKSCFICGFVSFIVQMYLFFSCPALWMGEKVEFLAGKFVGMEKKVVILRFAKGCTM